MIIYLIRHAEQESDLCNDNTPLCALGREQAKRLGERLSGYRIDELYSSDLLRAKQTAEIIKKRLAMDGNEIAHHIRPGIQEADFGDLTLVPNKDIGEQFSDFMESRFSEADDWGYPNGETGWQVYERAYPVLEEILASGKERVAVVTHGGTIRCLLTGIMLATLAAEGKQPDYAHVTQMNGMARRLFFGLKFKRGSITELYYDEKLKRFSIERFADAAHLEGLLSKKEYNELAKASNGKTNSKLRLILASGSPRRRELLSMAGYEYEVIKADCEEVITQSQPADVVRELAHQKACAVIEKVFGAYGDEKQLQGSGQEDRLYQEKENVGSQSEASKESAQNNSNIIVILGADTVVAAGEKNETILGKPKDEEEARKMIRSISGRMHMVYTGVCLLVFRKLEDGYHLDREICFSEETRVKVRSMTPEQIEAYVAKGESLDKAGAYGIQGSFAPYIEAVLGDYYNVVGLPVCRVSEQLEALIS